MKRLYKRLGWGAGLILPMLLVSCAGSQPKGERELSRQLREMEISQMELKNRLEELRNRFEMLEIRVKELQSRPRGVMEEGIPEPPLAADKKLREQEIIVPSSSTPVPAPPTASKAPPPPPKLPEKIEISVAGANEAKRLYDEAYKTYQSVNTQRARRLFQEFIQRFPRAAGSTAPTDSRPTAHTAAAG